MYITQDGVIDAITLDHTTGNATFSGDINAPGLDYDSSNKYLSISHWSSPPTPAAMLHLSDNSNSLDVPQIRIEGRENPGDTVLDIAVKDADVRFNLVEGSTDASNGYGKMHFKTNANSNSSNPTRGGFLFQTGAGTVIDALTITNEGNTVFDGVVLVGGSTPRQTVSTDVPIKLSVQGGMSEFETTLNNKHDWQNSPISILERGNIGSGSSDNKYAPNLNFHWSGIRSNSLWMSTNGHLNWGSYTSAGVPATDGTFKAAHGIFNSSVVTGSISATSGSFTEETHIADVVDGSFTALRLMNQKTYGSGTGTNEKVRFAMGISESGIAYSGREGFVIDVGVADQSDSSNAVINFQARDGGVIGTYQTVNGHDKSVSFVGAVTAASFTGNGSGLTNVTSSNVPSHNHDTRYTSTDASGDNYTFEIEDEGNFSNNKWYHVSTMDSGSGGLHIRGALLNHVENFASQKLDLAIQVREENDGGQLEIAGTVDILHNDSATNGTDKCGIRVIKSAETGTYDQFKVYVRTTRYQQLTLRLTQQGSVTFNTDHSSPLTSEPAPVSGGHVEIDTSTLTEGHHTIIDSVAKLTVAKDAATFAGTVKGTTFLINRTSAAGVGASLGDINGAELGPGYLSLSRDDTASAKQILFEKNDTEHSYIKTTSSKLILGSDTTGTTVALQLYHSSNPVSLGIDYSSGAALAFIESVHDSYDVNTHMLFKPGGTETWRIGSHGSSGSNKFVIKPSAAANDFELKDNSGDAVIYADTSQRFVGIGLNSALYQKLTVAGNIDIRGGNGGFLTFNNGDANIVVENNGTGRDLVFKTYNPDNGNNTERMRLDKNGNLKTNGYLQVINSSAEIWIGDSLSGTDGGFIKWNSTSDYLYIGNSYNSAFNEDIKIDNTGKVTFGGDVVVNKQIVGVRKNYMTTDRLDNWMVS